MPQIVRKVKQKRQQKQNEQKQRKSIFFLRAAVLLVLAAAFCVFSSDAVHGRWAFYLPKTITVNGTEVVVDDDLALNTYTEEEFAIGENGRVRYLSGEAMTGIDVSSHQGEIDWAQVAGDGIGFAMLRAGYRGYEGGTLNEDDRFRTNAEQAAANGLEIGAYFFSQATTPEEAVEEAECLLGLLDGVTLTMPVAFDWERIDESLSGGSVARTDGMTKEAVTDCAIAFCQHMEEAGLEAMIYCNNETGYFNFDVARLQEYPIWFAAYNTGWPNYYYRMELWQYTNSGTVAGISGSVDLNLWLPEQSAEKEAGSAV